MSPPKKEGAVGGGGGGVDERREKHQPANFIYGFTEALYYSYNLTKPAMGPRATTESIATLPVKTHTRLCCGSFIVRWSASMCICLV